LLAGALIVSGRPALAVATHRPPRRRSSLREPSRVLQQRRRRAWTGWGRLCRRLWRRQGIGPCRGGRAAALVSHRGHAVACRPPGLPLSRPFARRRWWSCAFRGLWALSLSSLARMAARSLSLSFMVAGIPFLPPSPPPQKKPPPRLIILLSAHHRPLVRARGACISGCFKILLARGFPRALRRPQGEVVRRALEFFGLHGHAFPVSRGCAALAATPSAWAGCRICSLNAQRGRRLALAV